MLPELARHSQSLKVQPHDLCGLISTLDDLFSVPFRADSDAGHQFICLEICVEVGESPGGSFQ